jgi:hypothetical protein
MARRPTVRAREHRGTNSLDLTVPASVCEEFGVKAGDVFEVSPSESTGQLSMTYRRVYRAHD